MTPKKKITFSIIALICVISINTFAADTENNGKCRAEVEKFCPNLTLKNGLGKCLRSHKSEFSKECQEKAESSNA